MKLSSLIGQTLASFSVVVAGSSSNEPLKMSFQKSFKKDERVLFKRDSPFVLEQIQNQGNFYSVNVSIGTPAQNVTVLLDTGSSDLWVMGPNNPFCMSNTTQSVSDLDSDDNLGTIDCSQYGTFDPAQSKTYHKNMVLPPFDIEYGDGSFATGNWSIDTLAMGGVKIPHMIFAVAEETNSTVGVFGIGLKGLESSASGETGDGITYKNFPYQLVKNNLTTRNVFSLYTNDLSAASGEILFGAVDTAKFEGGLYTLPLINTSPSLDTPTAIQFEVELQGIGFVNDQGVNKSISSQRLPALLDSGTSLMLLPSALLDSVASSLKLVPDNGDGVYLLPCPDSSSTAYFVFDFGGFQINVPLANFVAPTNRAGTCAFLVGAVDNPDGGAILGDLFLANAYVVYDLDNLEVSLAQAVFTNKTQIEVVTSDIPSAITAPGYSSTFSGYISANVESFTHSSADIFTVSSVVTPFGTPFSQSLTVNITAPGLSHTATKTGSHGGSSAKQNDAVAVGTQGYSYFLGIFGILAALI